MRKAVYAGSFDPVTNGHLWMIEQSAVLFDKLVVAIGENYEKTYSFSVDERMHFLRQLTDKFPNIEVAYFKNEFLVNYAKRIGAKFIIRGIRNSSDYEYEKSMRYINSDLNNDVSTVFLLPPRNYAEVSSNMVKGLVGSNGWEDVVRKYVSEPVYNKLHERYIQQKIEREAELSYD